MSRDHLTSIEVARIKSLRASGATAKFISRSLGISMRTVFLWSKKVQKPKVKKEREVIATSQLRIKMEIGPWYLDRDGCMTRRVRQS